MTRLELIDQMAEKTGFAKQDLDRFLYAAIEIIQAALKHGEKVMLTGVGVFIVKERKARLARNPKTGETLQVASKRVVGYKPSKELKLALAATRQDRVI